MRLFCKNTASKRGCAAGTEKRKQGAGERTFLKPKRACGCSARTERGKYGAAERTNLKLHRGCAASTEQRENGAAERSNLEPFDGDALLSELEDWADILEGEPEVARRLAVFAQAARGDGDIEQDAPEIEPPLEPSP